MKKALVLALVAIAAIAAAVSLGGKRAAAKPAFPALDGSAPEWSPANVKLLYRPAGMRFDLAAEFTLPAAAGARARMVLNAQDTYNYNWVELSESAVAIGRTEAGWETPLVSTGSGVSAAEPHTVRIKRRDAEIVVAIDGALSLTGYDETFGPGEVGAASRGRGVVFKRFEPPQEIGEEIALSDDFMRTKDEAGAWRVVRGEWDTVALVNPSMSANAFSYSGKGENALTTAGYPFWDDYRFDASVRAPEGGKVGLVAAMSESGYLLFRWSARSPEAPDAATPAAAVPDGARELVYIADGKEKMLASSPGGYVPGRWYRLRLEIGRGSAIAFIDGHKVLEAAEGRIVDGRVGLWVDSPKGASFDDVLVGQTKGLSVDFEESRDLGLWQMRGGSWSVAGGQLQGECARGGPIDTAEMLCGSKRWWRYSFGADVAPEVMAGIILNCASDSDMVRLDVNAQPRRSEERDTVELTLVRVSGGKETVLDKKEVPRRKSYALSTSCDLGHISAFLDGNLVLEGWDGSVGSGCAGLHLAGGRASFDNVRMTPLPSPEPLISTNAIFSGEQTMEDWSGPRGDWRYGRNAVQGVQPRWHRARFPGDVTLSLPIAEEKGEDMKFALSVAKSGDEGSPNNGYVMSADVNRAAAATGEKPAGTEGTLALKLLREGAAAVEKTMPAPKPLRSLDLRRSGSYMVGYVNGAEALQFRDPEPLSQAKVAWFARGAYVPDEGVEVYSSAVRNYTFGEAPADWRIACGTWAITNRWECDPRWSFFSGRSETARSGKGAEKLALIWNKRLYPGDVTVEFFVGPMMDRARGGQYEYARDFNVTIAADGKDPISGYTCMFGGYNDTRSLIARADKIIRVGGQVIPRHGSIHRRWFYVRVERQGNRVSFSVDDSMVDLTYDDPEPLTGQQIAIWTYDGGIMVSRVRISGPGGDVTEDPSTVATSRPKTIYDVAETAEPK